MLLRAQIRSTVLFLVLFLALGISVAGWQRSSFVVPRWWVQAANANLDGPIASLENFRFKQVRSQWKARGSRMVLKDTKWTEERGSFACEFGADGIFQFSSRYQKDWPYHKEIFNGIRYEFSPDSGYYIHYEAIRSKGYAFGSGVNLSFELNGEWVGTLVGTDGTVLYLELPDPVWGKHVLRPLVD